MALILGDVKLDPLKLDALILESDHLLINKELSLDTLNFTP
jgi:hypothetical protein